MADENGAAQSAQTWPVPEFHFSVDITDVGKISCKEVSGLDIEFDVIEYRSGDMPGFTKVKMPGLHVITVRSASTGQQKPYRVASSN